ncbi:hypothetical protein N301_16756, partial [Charadrius vociferus]
MRAERLGATWLILERRYSCRPLRYSDSEMTRLEKLSMLMRSRGEMSIPVETGIGGFQDGLCLGAGHDNLFQPLQALLTQLLTVPDELGQPAVGVVLRDNLDQLGKVVPV